MAKTYKKAEIDEIIDGDDNIIGSDAKPTAGPDMETRASKTTDYNAKVHGQNFKNDFLGRFGFYFYEGEKLGKSPIIEDIEAIVGEEHVNSVMETIKLHLEKTIDETNFNLNENNVQEDKITSKKDNSITTKQNKSEFVNKKIEDVAELLNKLPKKDINSLINLLETNNVTKPDNLKKKMEEVSLGKDDDGYYVYTHRARSKSYGTPDKIPDSKIKFIASTG